MTPPGNRNDSTQTPLLIAIGAVGLALVVVIGIALGLALTRTDDDPDTPDAAPPATSESRERTSETSGDTTSSTSTSTSTSSSTSSTSSSTSTSRTTSSRTSSTTTSESTTSESTAPTSEPRDDDLGTGRDDVDARGWIASRARCHDGDRALAVVATETGTRAAACETPGGDKYYRGDAGDGNLEAPIIVDEGDRIVAQNGSWKYQMSPEGLLITENNEIRDRQTGTVWGRSS